VRRRCRPACPRRARVPRRDRRRRRLQAGAGAQARDAAQRGRRRADPAQPHDPAVRARRPPRRGGGRRRRRVASAHRAHHRAGRRRGGARRLPSRAGGHRRGRRRLGRAARARARAQPRPAHGVGDPRIRDVRRARRAAHRHLRTALAGVRLGVPDRRRPGQHRLRRGAARPDAQPHPPAPAARRAAARGGPAGGRQPARPPPPAVHVAPQPGDRAGPARRRRPLDDQPVHRRGHLLRRALRRPGRPYANALRRRLGRHLRHSAAAAWLARRPSVIQAAVRAAGRDRGVFDSIVELGLGDGLLEPRTLGHIARALAVRS
jgi:hypothetical protein